MRAIVIAGWCGLVGCNPILGLDEPSLVPIDADGDGIDSPDSGDGGDAGDAIDSPDSGDGGRPMATAIAAGGSHTCASLNGRVRCWGRAEFGQLGYGNTTTVGDNEFPAAAGDVNLGADALTLATGRDHTCAVLVGGTLTCWGNGGNGRLGHGDNASIGDNETPVVLGAVQLGLPVISVAAGAEHTCAVTTTGAVYCWGKGSDGRLGYGNTLDRGDDELPFAVGPVPGLGPVAAIAAGGSHTCALLTDATVRCWGNGNVGQLGYASSFSIGDNEPPLKAQVLLGAAALQIVAGDLHTCALLNNGTVTCWGLAVDGRLGYGDDETIGDNESPQVAGPVQLGGAAIQLAAGGAHTCALLNNGAVTCWGRNSKGQLGYGHTNHVGDNETPAIAGSLPLGAAVLSISAGAEHTCARLASGDVRCWGNGDDGRLGLGDSKDIGDDEPPSSVPTIPL